MATRKTTATPKTEQNAEKNNGSKTERKTEQKSEQKIETKSDAKANPKAETKAAEKAESVTLEQALKEEGEGRTPETIKTERKNTGGPTKMDQAKKIMEEMWDDIQAGKVKRKDVIKRFMEEIPLSKAGSSTYYGTIKSRLMKTD